MLLYSFLVIETPFSATKSMTVRAALICFPWPDFAAVSLAAFLVVWVLIAFSKEVTEAFVKLTKSFKAALKTFISDLMFWRSTSFCARRILSKNSWNSLSKSKLRQLRVGGAIPLPSRNDAINFANLFFAICSGVLFLSVLALLGVFSTAAATPPAVNDGKCWHKSLVYHRLPGPLLPWIASPSEASAQGDNDIYYRYSTCKYYTCNTIFFCGANEVQTDPLDVGHASTTSIIHASNFQPHNKPSKVTDYLAPQVNDRNAMFPTTTWLCDRSCKSCIYVASEDSAPPVFFVSGSVSFLLGVLGLSAGGKAEDKVTRCTRTQHMREGQYIFNCPGMTLSNAANWQHIKFILKKQANGQG